MAESDRVSGDEALLAELIRGVKLVDAARSAAMAERTARRRLADPAFRARLNDGRRELVGLTVVRLASVADRAVDTLNDLLGESTADGHRLGAAREALRHLQTFAEMADAGELAERLDRLERRLGLSAVDDGEAAA
jgi:hypothetical protein